MPANPYRGEEFFDVEHAGMFFGRERVARELVEEVRRHRLVAVIGVAGSGKSSLVRAGLAQALEEAGEPPLRVVVPGEPLPMPGHQGLVLVVDQFERALTGDAGLIDRLLDYVGPRVSVVLALDADAYGAALAHDRLAAAMVPFTLPPMSGRELREAIEEPARRGGAPLEPGLAARMAGDMRGAADLPPLSDTLYELWERDAAGGVLTAASYDALGGLDGARAELETDADAAPPARPPRTRRRVAAAKTRRLPAIAVAAVVAAAMSAGVFALLNASDDDGPEASRAIAAVALPALDRRFDTGLLLSLEAWRTAPTVEARGVALAALRRTDGMLALLRNRSRAEVSAVALGGGVLAATDGTAVSLFDIPHRRLAARLISPDGSDAVAVAVSRNGYLAAVAFGRDVMLHDLSSRRTVRLDGRVTALAFSPDGARLAGAGPRQLRVWDNDGRALHEDTLPRANASVAADVGFDEQGRSLTEIRGGRLTAWSVERWQRRSTADLPRALDGALALSPSGQRVASGRSLWRVGSRQVLTLAHASFPGAKPAFSPDDRRLAIPARDGTIRRYDVATGRETDAPFTGGRDALSVTWDSATLVSGGRSGLITLWSADGGHALATRVRGSGGDQVSAGRTGALAWSDGSVLNLRTRSELLQRGVNGHAIEFTADGRSIVTAEPQRVRVFDLALQERGTHIPDASVTGLATGPDNLIVYGDAAGQVHLWEIGRFGELRSSSTAAQPVGAVALASDGLAVASAIGNSVRLFGVEQTRLRDGPVLRGHDGRVTGVAFTPDGLHLATSAEDATVRLWSRTGFAIGAPLWAGGELEALAFSPDGRTLAAAQADGAIRLWDVPTRRPLGPPLAGQARDLAFGRSLVAAGPAGLVRHSALLWAGGPDQLAGRFCAIAGRELTEEEWRAYVPGKDRRPTCNTR